MCVCGGGGGYCFSIVCAHVDACKVCVCVCVCVRACVCACVRVSSCLETKVLIGKYLATRRVVVSVGGGNCLQVCCMHLNWDPLDHADPI